MKQLIVIAGLAVASLLYSCSKTNTPIPPPVDNGTGTGNSGNTGGNTGGGTTTPPTYARVNIYTTGGNGSFDKSNTLVGIELGDPLINSNFKTGQSTNTATTTKLIHAEGGVVDKNLGQWGMKFPEYSETDTTKQPYLRTIVTDGNKKVTEYRTYIVGTDSYLYKYEANKPADKMTVTDFVASFETQNVQNVLRAEAGSGTIPVLSKVIIVNGGIVTYDVNGNIARVKFTSQLGTTVDLVPTGDATIEIVNEELDKSPNITLSKGASSFKYNNLYKSNINDLGNADNIKKILSNDVYIRLKNLKDYGQVDMIITDDGSYLAGSIGFNNTNDITSSAKIEASFSKAKLKIQNLIIK